MSEFTMNGLAVGDCGYVTALHTTGAMRRRLQDLGLVEGTRVQCLQKSPAGDPVAYLIRGAVIALRLADSAEIVLRPAPAEEATTETTDAEAATAASAVRAAGGIRSRHGNG